MIKKIQQVAKGVTIGGQNCIDLRYADDAVFISDQVVELQKTIDKVNEVCKDFGMELNVKRTKTMAFSKTEKAHFNITVNSKKLEQVTWYKYLGSWVTEDGKCDLEENARIGMAKDAVWKYKELLKGNTGLQTKKRILHCYVYSVLKYACESWTMNSDLIRRINAFDFEQWCYRRILKIKWTDRIPNAEVMQRMKVPEMCLYKSIQKQKMAFAGHVTEATNVSHTDGISRHRLMPYDVYTLQYKYDLLITVRFPITVQMDVRFKTI